MLEYDRIDISEEIDVNKTNDSREYIIFNIWYFLELNYRFHPNVCDGYHDLMQKVLNFNDIVIVSVTESIKEFTFGMSKDDAINLLRNDLTDLTEKPGAL